MPPKRLRDYPICLAPQIQGVMKPNWQPEVFDAKMKENLDPNNIDDKIKIYDRQVKAWFLDPGSSLLGGENNGFIVLMIGISYIEGVQQYINGRNSGHNSKQTFKEGLNRIFSLDNVADYKLDDFYKQVRCGLFHNGMSGSQVLINNTNKYPIDFSEYQTIKINPKSFLKAIKEDFESYIAKLKDETNVNMRTNFNNMFSVL